MTMSAWMMCASVGIVGIGAVSAGPSRSYEDGFAPAPPVATELIPAEIANQRAMVEAKLATTLRLERAAAFEAYAINPQALQYNIPGPAYCIRIYACDGNGNRQFVGDRWDGRTQFAVPERVGLSSLAGEYPRLTARIRPLSEWGVEPEPPKAPAPEPEPTKPESTEKPAATPPAVPAQAVPAPKSDEASLDELLGLPGGEKAASEGDAAAADLDRKLSGEEVGPALNQAVALMGDASKRLATGKDASLQTQRVQEDVIRRLDQLIASLDKMRQQSSSSSSQSKQNQQNQQQPNQPQKQQGQNQEQRGQENSSPQTAPGLREGVLGPDVNSAKAVWGNLPDRVREMLMQGRSDRFSPTYQRLTEQFYKRLAEEAKNP